MKRTASLVAMAITGLSASMLGCRPAETAAAPPERPIPREPRVAAEAASSDAEAVAAGVEAVAAVADTPATSSNPMATPETLELTEATYLAGRLRMSVPMSFTAMSDEMMRLKYPTETRPTFVLTDETGGVNITIGQTRTPVLPSQLSTFHRVLTLSFKEQHPESEWFQNDLGTINGKQFFLMDFRSQAIDTEVRNILMGTSDQGKLLLIGYNMTREQEEAYLPLANEIIESVRLY